MGREIRRVPPNWEHPRYTEQDATSEYRVGELRPLCDETYEDARAEWLEGLEQWLAGTHPEHREFSEEWDYWEWVGDPPQRDMYRPVFEEEPTWYQVYETVSEGSPVTPPFATKQELVDYLCTHGDFWAQKNHERLPTQEQAQAFVDAEWAMSTMAVREAGSTTILGPYEQSGVRHDDYKVEK